MAAAVTEPLSWDEFQANRENHARCTFLGDKCYSMHCSYCGVSCSSQGHFGCEYRKAGLYPENPDECRSCGGCGSIVGVSGEDDWDEWNCPDCVGA